MIEVAKQQLLDKLHLKERPNITQAVPRAALLTALRKLHSGRVRPNRTLEQESNLSKKDQSYEIVSFAELRKSGIHLSSVSFMTQNRDLGQFYAQRSPNSALRTNGVTDNGAALSVYTCCPVTFLHLLPSII